MMHPAAQLRFINSQIGYGLFATEFIPVGTIVYVKDPLEITLAPDSSLLQDPLYGDIVKKYAIIEPDGKRVVSWDIAKYVNHCCRCNTLSTGYHFEIAIQDIQPDEEITDDYGLFNFETEMPLVCRREGCRQMVRPDDLDRYSPLWDEAIKPALAKLTAVPQPLLKYLDADTHAAVTHYIVTGQNYKSIQTLKRPRL